MAAFSLAALTAAAMVVAPSAAQATGFTSWKRSCGTSYTGFSSVAFANTEKEAGGTCKGDAWVKAYYSDTRGGRYWSGWLHGAKSATYVAVNVNILNAQHKGCAECEVHRT